MEQAMSDLNIDQRLDKIENEIKALTELLAKMHVDLYMHVNNIPEPTDEEDTVR